MISDEAELREAIGSPQIKRDPCFDADEYNRERAARYARREGFY